MIMSEHNFEGLFNKYGLMFTAMPQNVLSTRIQCNLETSVYIYIPRFLTVTYT